MFKPEARWDRQLPGEKNKEIINENIAVEAFFNAGKLIPKCFFWNRRPYMVSKVNCFWQSREGNALLTFFSVNTNDLDNYEISFNNRTFNWRIHKILV
jgi:hypothetical protein